MKRNHIWVIEWKCSEGYKAIDYEYKKSDANAIMKKYKDLNEHRSYRIKKYVSEK